MMLHFIREKAKGWFAWAIVILISIPFALWGVNSYITPDSNPAVATVGESQITTYEFQNAVQNEQQQSQGQGNERQIKSVVLERLINNYALLNLLTESGYTVSKSQLDQQIVADPNFVDPDTGKFSEQVFRQILSRMGMNLERYRNSLTKDILIEQYLQGIQQSAIITDAEIEQVMKLVKQKRDISYVEIKSDGFKETIQPTDEQILEHYQTHQVEFEVPETVQLEYLQVSRDTLAKAIEVDETEIQKYYEENNQNYTSDEERQASHILISFKADDSDEIKEKAKQEIEGIHKRLKEGEDFATLAKEFSKDPGSATNGGDLGYFKKGDMVPEFEEKAFGTAVNDITEPFESPFGYHIIMVTAIKDSQVKPLTEVKQEIISKIQFDKAEKPYYEKSEALETIAYEQPDSLEPAAIEIDLKVEKSPFISRNGGEDIFANPKLLEKAFSEQVLETGTNSDVVDLGNDNVVVVRLSERVPASIKPLEQVTDTIKDILIQKMATERAIELADSLLKTFNEGNGIDEQLKQNNLEMIDKGLIERADKETPRSITQKAFTMPRVTDKPLAETVKVPGNNAALIIVKAVEDGKNDDEQYAQTIRSIMERSRGQLFGNLGVMQARAETSIERNEKAIYGEQ